MQNTHPDSPSSFPFGQKICWTPNPEWIENSNLKRFMDRHGISTYTELFERSTTETAWFWDAVLEDMDIRFNTPYSRILDTSDGVPFSKWCVDGRMNIVSNLLDKWIHDGSGSREALRFENENGEQTVWTYQNLNDEVCRIANALRQLGIGKGDVTGFYMSMTPQLVAAFLAVIKVGGIVLPLFSGYGASAIVTRLQDAGAVALFTDDFSTRKGKTIEMKRIVDEALTEVPTVRTVIVRSAGTSADHALVSERDCLWDDLIPFQSESANTEDTSAEDVCMLIYTSGTTGRPKGAVHTHCGFPIKGAQDLYHCMDLKPDDVLFWMSDMGWMMGPWMVFGALTIGATMVLYDGAADYPDVSRLWSLIENHRVTHLGLSPVLVRSLMTHGTEPIKKHDVSSLRMVGSTGSPWDPDSWIWLFEHVLESRKPILNYSGGTEISGGILCGNFFQPLKPASFSGPVPGMAADVVDPDGNSVIGEVGELIIRKPWIGMTRGFWLDNDRYLDSYWRRFENCWHHGDFAAIDRDGLWYILGRSDDTIKVAGKRLGPAEVEVLLNSHPDVLESAAIGVPDPKKGETLVVFCVLIDPLTGNKALAQALSDLIVKELGRPLKPREVHFPGSLPKTRNAKVMRRLIRAVYLDQPIGDVSAIENPETLTAIKISIQDS